ncbi:Short-chain dehydrogenase/reductase SDR [Ilyonectria robusta]
MSPSVKIEFLKCDLADHESIVNAVRTNFTPDRLDILIANAGVCAVPPAMTRDGHEIQFGTGLVKDLSLFSKVLVYLGAGFRPKSPEEGARNQLWAATTALNNVRSGAYYEPVGKEAKLGSTARDGNLSKRLWDWTEEQLKALDIQ